MLINLIDLIFNRYINSSLINKLVFIDLILGRVTSTDLDERALESLRDFSKDFSDMDTDAILKQFVDANPESLSNKSAYLCGIIKNFRQLKGKPIHSSAGPDEEKLKVGITVA